MQALLPCMFAKFQPLEQLFFSAVSESHQRSYNDTCGVDEPNSPSAVIITIALLTLL